MSNAKEVYSKLSQYYVEYAVPSTPDLQSGYIASKKREALFNENWKKNKVNINEIIDKYTPNVTPKVHGVKSVWKNKDYIIKADMASGYLKVYDRNLKTFLDKYGNLVPDGPDSHMKILRKEEM